MKAVAACVAFALMAAACASNPARKTLSAATPAPISSAEIAARLAEADAMAARGCYLCLREAAGLYYNLIQFSDAPAVLTHALENDLMMAIREVELRLPDSGARERARAVTVRLPPSRERYGETNYGLYFDVLDAISNPVVVGGSITMAEVRRREAEQKILADKLALNWKASAMAAYFYVAGALNAGQIATLRSVGSAIVDAFPQNLSVRYRVQASPLALSGASAELLAQEPRFAEAHFMLGERAVAGRALVTGHKELSLAYDALPESLTIALAFGNLELAFGRHPQALALFDRVLARELDRSAQLGRAIALSSLTRHHDAIAALDEMLKDLSWRPGDKYYWRAWNYLQLGESQPAYDDATAALKSMANTDVYQLAGIASYNLTRVAEARTDFESSVQMNAANCDSIRYLGVIDASERKWPSAMSRFTTAAACYKAAIEQLESDLAQKQADTSGLYAGQVTGLVAEIAQARTLLDASVRNAEVAGRNK